MAAEWCSWLFVGRIAASSALLLLLLSTCASDSNKEQMYFATTERCQNYFSAELESSVAQAQEAMGAEKFLYVINKNAYGELAQLLKSSSVEFRSIAGGANVVFPMNTVQKQAAYEAITNNIALISQCRGVEAYISTYLLSDQLRLIARERKVPILASYFEIDPENQDDVAKALLAALIASRRLSDFE